MVDTWYELHWDIGQRLLYRLNVGGLLYRLENVFGHCPDSKRVSQSIPVEEGMLDCFNLTHDSARRFHLWLRAMTLPMK